MPGIIVESARARLVQLLGGGQLRFNAVREVEMIASAALKVTPVEPLPRDHPLTRMDNVIFTPHTAFHSLESLNELEVRTAREVVRVLNREMPVNVFNPAVLGKSRAGL